MEDQYKPVVDHQRRLTHAMREVVKKEVIVEGFEIESFALKIVGLL
jgi:hypothetical protein